MGRTIAEDIRQTDTIKLIVCVGLFAYLICVMPICFGSKLANHGFEGRFTTTFPMHCARFAITIPLICDCVYDTSLPKRLTFPKYILILSLFIPSAVPLAFKLANTQYSMAELLLSVASYNLFICALAGFMAGEVRDGKLLYYLASVSVISSTAHIYLGFQFVFAPLTLPQTKFKIAIMVLRFVIGIALAWFVIKMKTLDDRRKDFARVYAAGILFYLATPFVIYPLILTFHETQKYSGDFVIITQLLVASYVSIVPSRMALRDAVTIMVCD